MPVRPAKKLKGLPLERVVITHNDDFGGETLEVGSMS